MAEIMIVCAECGQDLEEHKTEIKWGGLVIQAIPCEECLSEAAENDSS